MRRPDDRHLERLGVDKRLSRQLALLCHALEGKTVLSFSSRRHHAEAERRDTLELLVALGIEPSHATTERISFASGGAITFAAADTTRRLEGASPQIVDGANLLPYEWKVLLGAHGSEVW